MGLFQRPSTHHRGASPGPGAGFAEEQENRKPPASSFSVTTGSSGSSKRRGGLLGGLMRGRGATSDSASSKTHNSRNPMPPPTPQRPLIESVSPQQIQNVPIAVQSPAVSRNPQYPEFRQTLQQAQKVESFLSQSGTFKPTIGGSDIEHLFNNIATPTAQRKINAQLRAASPQRPATNISHNPSSSRGYKSRAAQKSAYPPKNSGGKGSTRSAHPQQRAHNTIMASDIQSLSSVSIQRPSNPTALKPPTPQGIPSIPQSPFHQFIQSRHGNTPTTPQHPAGSSVLPSPQMQSWVDPMIQNHNFDGKSVASSSILSFSRKKSKRGLFSSSSPSRNSPADISTTTNNRDHPKPTTSVKEQAAAFESEKTYYEGMRVLKEGRQFENVSNAFIQHFNAGQQNEDITTTNNNNKKDKSKRSKSRQKTEHSQHQQSQYESRAQLRGRDHALMDDATVDKSLASNTSSYHPNPYNNNSSLHDDTKSHKSNTTMLKGILKSNGKYNNGAATPKAPNATNNDNDGNNDEVVKQELEEGGSFDIYKSQSHDEMFIGIRPSSSSQSSTLYTDEHELIELRQHLNAVEEDDEPDTTPPNTGNVAGPAIVADHRPVALPQIGLDRVIHEEHRPRDLDGSGDYQHSLEFSEDSATGDSSSQQSIQPQSQPQLQHQECPPTTTTDSAPVTTTLPESASENTEQGYKSIQERFADMINGGIRTTAKTSNVPVNEATPVINNKTMSRTSALTNIETGAHQDLSVSTEGKSVISGMLPQKMACAGPSAATVTASFDTGVAGTPGSVAALEKQDQLFRDLMKADGDKVENVARNLIKERVVASEKQGQEPGPAVGSKVAKAVELFQSKNEVPKRPTHASALSSHTKTEPISQKMAASQMATPQRNNTAASQLPTPQRNNITRMEQYENQHSFATEENGDDPILTEVLDLNFSASSAEGRDTKPRQHWGNLTEANQTTERPTQTVATNNQRGKQMGLFLPDTQAKNHAKLSQQNYRIHHSILRQPSSAQETDIHPDLKGANHTNQSRSVYRSHEHHSTPEYPPLIQGNAFVVNQSGERQTSSPVGPADNDSWPAHTEINERMGPNTDIEHVEGVVFSIDTEDDSLLREDPVLSTDEPLVPHRASPLEFDGPVPSAKSGFSISMARSRHLSLVDSSSTLGDCDEDDDDNVENVDTVSYLPPAQSSESSGSFGPAPTSASGEQISALINRLDNIEQRNVLTPSDNQDDDSGDQTVEDEISEIKSILNGLKQQTNKRLHQEDPPQDDSNVRSRQRRERPDAPDAPEMTRDTQIKSAYSSESPSISSGFVKRQLARLEPNAKYGLSDPKRSQPEARSAISRVAESHQGVSVYSRTTQQPSIFPSEPSNRQYSHRQSHHALENHTNGQVSDAGWPNDLGWPDDDGFTEEEYGVPGIRPADVAGAKHARSRFDNSAQSPKRHFQATPNYGDDFGTPHHANGYASRQQNSQSYAATNQPSYHEQHSLHQQRSFHQQQSLHQQRSFHQQHSLRQQPSPQQPHVSSTYQYPDDDNHYQHEQQDFQQEQPDPVDELYYSRTESDLTTSVALEEGGIVTSVMMDDGIPMKEITSTSARQHKSNRAASYFDTLSAGVKAVGSFDSVSDRQSSSVSTKRTRETRGATSQAKSQSSDASTLDSESRDDGTKSTLPSRRSDKGLKDRILRNAKSHIEEMGKNGNISEPFKARVLRVMDPLVGKSSDDDDDDVSTLRTDDETIERTSPPKSYFPSCHFFCG